MPPQGPAEAQRTQELLNLKGIERAIDGFAKAVQELPASAVQHVEAALAKASIAHHAGRYQGRIEAGCICLPFGLLLGLLLAAVRSPKVVTLLLLLAPLSVPPLRAGEGVGGAVSGRVDPVSGREVLIDLPVERHLRNKGGLTWRGANTGSGLCVFTSAEMAADWCNFRPLIGLRDWMAANREGGGWPEKVRAIFAERAPQWNGYLQATGDQAGVALMDWAMANGRMACVTYGAAHMVNLVHLDAEGTPSPRAAILDNNRPGVFQWMSRPEFLARWRRSGSGWAFVLLEPPPPPIPKPKEQAMYAAILSGTLALLGDGASADRALIVVHVPTRDARVEVDGLATESRGLERRFRTQPVGPGRHTHRLRVTWSLGDSLGDGLGDGEWETVARFTAGDELHVHVPAVIEQKPDDVPDLIPGGVVADRIRADRLWIGADEVDPKHFFGPALPAADGVRPYVAVVGDEAFQSAARRFFAAPDNARVAGRLTVGYFRPDSWHLRYDRQHPVIPAGVTVFAATAGASTPLHHQTGLDQLDVALAEALRKVDPQFDAAAIPDLRKVTGGGGGNANWLALAAGALVLVLVGFAFRR